MSNSTKKPEPILVIALIGGFLSGLFLAILGAFLFSKGATGDTEIEVFGQSLRSTNVGIAAIFIGAAVIVLVVTRVLKVLETKPDVERPSESKRGPKVFQDISRIMNKISSKNGEEDEQDR